MLASVAEKMSLDLVCRTSLKTGFLKTTGHITFIEIGYEIMSSGILSLLLI